MKQLSTFFLLFSMFLFAASCSQAPEGEQVEASEVQQNEQQASPAENSAKLTVDADNARIFWEGTKPGGGHTGIIKLQKGYLQMANGKISGGEFVIDMNSIENTDQEGQDKEDLQNHLRSSDFFDAGQFPTATFTITDAKPLDGREDANYLITGNLSMKGITKSISIPAKVQIAETYVEVETPKFTIDRTQWGITYKSGIIGTAKDRLINDQIGLQIKLQANL